MGYFWFRVFIVVVSDILIVSRTEYNLALIAVVIIALPSPLVGWRAAILRARFEAIHCKMDFYDGLARQVSSRERNEWFYQLRKSQRVKVRETENMPSTYFRSGKNPSPLRLLENLMESACWTKHLSGTMFVIFTVVVVVCCFMSVLALGMAIHLALSEPDSAGIAYVKIVLSIIASMFALDLVRIAATYRTFSRACSRIEEIAESMTQQGQNVDLAEAIFLVYEYQNLRAASPTIPTWVWRRRRDELNKRCL